LLGFLSKPMPLTSAADSWLATASRLVADLAAATSRACSRAGLRLLASRLAAVTYTPRYIRTSTPRRTSDWKCRSEMPAAYQAAVVPIEYLSASGRSRSVTSLAVPMCRARHAERAVLGYLGCLCKRNPTLRHPQYPDLSDLPCRFGVPRQL